MSEANERYAPVIELRFLRREPTEDECNHIETFLRESLTRMMQDGVKIPCNADGEAIIQRPFENSFAEVMGCSFADVMNGFSLAVKEPKP